VGELKYVLNRLNPCLKKRRISKMDRTSFLTKQAVHVILLSAGISGLIFVAQILIARNMNPREFSIYSAVMALINVFGILFSSLLLNQVKLIKSSEGALSSKFFDRGTRGVLILGALLAAAFLALVGLENTGTSTVTIFLAGVFIPLIAILAALNAKLQGLGKLRTLGIGSLTAVSIALIGHVVLIQLNLLNLNSALVATLVANIVTVAIFSMTLQPAGLASSSIFSAPAIKLALISSGYWIFVNGDILLSPLWLADLESGEYSAASAVAKIPVIVSGLFSGLLLNDVLNHKRKANSFPAGIVVKYLFIEIVIVLGFLSSIYFFGDTSFKSIYGAHLSSEPGFLLHASVVSIPLVISGVAVQVLVAYSNSWVPSLAIWVLSAAFLGTGHFVSGKEDLVSFYLLGSGLLAITLSMSVVYYSQSKIRTL
jgi:hypothetical protein